MQTIFMNIIIYLIITYVLGIVVGFSKNGYSVSFYMFFKNAIPYAVLILVRELYRYLMVRKIKDSKSLLVLSIILFVLLDVNLYVNAYDISKTLGLTKMICLVIFPSVSKNILLDYLQMKVGISNAIFYSLIMELKEFALPIFPDFGVYVGTILDVSFPIYLTLNIYGKFRFNEKRRITSSRYNKKNLFFYSIVTIVLFTIVMLTSGYFKYYALTIGSESMEPNIKKGDAIIVDKIKIKDMERKLKKGQVLVYNYDKKIIVHRIVSIKKINNKVYYKTKGDNNLTKDAWNVEKKDIIGIVVFRIPFIGYPTVSLNERIDSEG